MDLGWLGWISVCSSLVKKKKIYHLVHDVDYVEVCACVGAGGERETSGLPSQFCCKPTAALKKVSRGVGGGRGFQDGEHM